MLASAIAYATEHLGIAYTASILQEHPFNFARRVSTLDHASKGRVAWNIVTNYLPNASRNFGLEGLTKHDERYAWADEYVDVTYKLWEGSWEEDALVQDRESGIHAHYDKVHRINHEGPRYKVEGPHLVSPSPQRTPLLFQAGASEAGRSFAARNAEAVFIQAPTLEAAARDTGDIRSRAVAAGRQADDLKFFQGLYVVPASTEEEARRKAAELDEWIDYDAQLSHMSGAVGVDFGHDDLDTPVGEIRTEGVQSIVGWIHDLVTDRPATLRDVAHFTADQQPHCRHARADRGPARGLAGGRRRRHQPRQCGDPRQLRGVRRPRRPDPAGPRARADRVPRGHPAREALRPRRSPAGAAPGDPLPRRLRPGRRPMSAHEPAADQPKRLILNLFEMNCVSHITHGLWRLPDNNRERFNDIEYWTELARLLEDGGFDAVFLADVVGTYDVFRGSAETAVRQGLQIPNNDPAVVVPAMAAVTKHLGFGITFSTTYEPPFAWARRASTLDHLTKGRVGWNIVTSYLPNAARNFGLEGEVEHDERFARADEYLDVLYKLWEGSWDDDAIVADREHNVFADPAEDPPDRPRRHLLQGPGAAPAVAEPAAHAAADHGDPVRRGHGLRGQARRGRLHRRSRPAEPRGHRGPGSSRRRSMPVVAAVTSRS